MKLFIIICSLAIIVYAIVANKKQRCKVSLDKSSNLEQDNLEDTIIDMNEKFLKNKNQNEITKLVKVYNPNDMLILRSLLDGSSIETYVDKHSLNNLYPGVFGLGTLDSIIYVYKEKMEEAKIIVIEYINSLNSGTSNKKTSTMRNIIEFTSVNISVQSNDRKLFPELLV